MKKNLIFIILYTVVLMSAAQTYDTIYNRASNGYYHRWYDTCDNSHRLPEFINFNLSYYDSASITVISSYTPQPMLVTGGIVMVSRTEFNPDRWYFETGKPEYVMLYQYNSRLQTMVLLDSVRWDTASPKILFLPDCVDTWVDPRDTGATCFAYEVRFKHPVMVDSTFYMGVTQNSNVHLSLGWFKYKPIMCRKIVQASPRGCKGDTLWYYSPRSGWNLYPSSNVSFGGVIPTVDTFHLQVATSDSLRGEASGSGTFTNMSRRTITATAYGGYRFAHWGDGNRDNPREILLTQDTLFTAHFVERGQVYADVRSNDEGMGTVTGSGVYLEEDTIVLSATPYPYYKFLCWDDSVRDNPRELIITQDTVITAQFAPFDRFQVRAEANNAGRGRVEGGGEYYEGDTATLTALPWTLWGFLQWADGDTANPRHVVVTQDTALTAIFVSREAIEAVSEGEAGFSLMPNPAWGSVNCVLHDAGLAGGTLTVVNALGQDVLRKDVAPQTQVVELSVENLPQGVYYVTLTTPRLTTMQKLLVK